MLTKESNIKKQAPGTCFKIKYTNNKNYFNVNFTLVLIASEELPI